MPIVNRRIAGPSNRIAPGIVAPFAAPLRERQEARVSELLALVGVLGCGYQRALLLSSGGKR